MENMTVDSTKVESCGVGFGLRLSNCESFKAVAVSVG